MLGLRYDRGTGCFSLEPYINIRRELQGNLREIFRVIKYSNNSHSLLRLISYCPVIRERDLVLEGCLTPSLERGWGRFQAMLAKSDGVCVNPPGIPLSGLHSCLSQVPDTGSNILLQRLDGSACGSHRVQGHLYFCRPLNPSDPGVATG